MSTTVAFLAESPGSPSLDEQKACLDADDYVLLADKRGFNQLSDLLTRAGVALRAGDRVKIYDLTCLALSTTMLIRAFAKLLDEGIRIEIVSPGLLLEPGDRGQKHVLLGALDGHYRHIHGIKTHPVSTAPQGRKRLLDPEQLPAIRAKLDKPGSTATDVALELGVARSTLFNFLERYDRDRGSGRVKKRIERRSKDSGDNGHVPKRDTSETST